MIKVGDKLYCHNNNAYGKFDLSDDTDRIFLTIGKEYTTRKIVDYIDKEYYISIIGDDNQKYFFTTNKNGQYYFRIWFYTTQKY